MHSHRLQTVEEIRSFLAGATTFDFEPQSRKETYRWVRDSLRQLRYSSLGRADRGAVREYLRKVTGMSRSQVTRLIRQYQETGGIRDRRGRNACGHHEFRLGFRKRLAARMPQFALYTQSVNQFVRQHGGNPFIAFRFAFFTYQAEPIHQSDCRAHQNPSGTNHRFLP